MGLRELVARGGSALGIVEPAVSAGARKDDPLLWTWLTRYSGQYARVVEVSGRGGVTTWPTHRRGRGGQQQPSYSDVQSVAATPDYVYVTSTGLPSHPLGPWGDSDAWPSRRLSVYRLPRMPWLVKTPEATPPGDVGVWVNGVPIPNLLSGGHFDPERGREVLGAGDDDERCRNLWLRHVGDDACSGVDDLRGMDGLPVVDPSNGWPTLDGVYRYWGNPLALRSQVRDNVAYAPCSDCYREDTENSRHSPILGWTFEGLPIYGPYGYAIAVDSRSRVRRMISGFVARDRRKNRRSLPKWAASLHGVSDLLDPRRFGPDVSREFELGRYIEDYDYLGDLGFVQGRDFDLDTCNGRYCVTPEFPRGTYAYFVSIAYDGSPAFPYVIGPRSYGRRDGGASPMISTDAELVIAGGVAAPVRLEFRNVGSQQLLTWTSIEGGYYTVEGSHDGRLWIELAHAIRSQGLITGYTVYVAADARPYRRLRVTLSALDPYEA